VLVRLRLKVLTLRDLVKSTNISEAAAYADTSLHAIAMSYVKYASIALYNSYSAHNCFSHTNHGTAYNMDFDLVNQSQSFSGFFSINTPLPWN
jgi:hypothetical protein